MGNGESLRLATRFADEKLPRHESSKELGWLVENVGPASKSQMFISN
jgi:hypothetical protein